MSALLNAGRISTPRPNIRLQTRSPQAEPLPLTGDILDPINLKPSVKVKIASCISHFNKFLLLRNEQLTKDGEEIGKTEYKDLTFADVDTGTYISGFAYYLAKTARRYKKVDGNLLSYASATGYMSAIKSDLITKFRFTSAVPKQLSTDVWRRYMTTMFGIMFERSRRERKPLQGSKKSCDAKDRFGIMAVCIWDGTLQNAELMNFFQSMVMNCGRGCEIALSRLDHLNMKTLICKLMMPKKASIDYNGYRTSGPPRQLIIPPISIL